MRTRLVGLLLFVAVAVLPITTAGAALAATTFDGAVVLATEGGFEQPGPEPATADDPDNEFAPADYDRPWTWWMGPVLIVAMLPLLLGGSALYYFLVYRPTQAAGTKR